MRHIILLLMVLGVCHSIQAQQAPSSLDDQVKNAQLHIVKYTVEFLTTDAATFHNIKKDSCSGCLTYKNLQAFATSHQLTGASELIKRWQNIPIKTTKDEWEKSLTAFKDTVLANITSGNTRKQQRKKLAGYKDYESKLNEAIAIVSPLPAPLAKPVADPKDVDAGTSQANNNDNKPQVKANNNNKPDRNAKADSKKEEQHNSSGFSLVIPYIVCVLLTGAIYFIWKKISKERKKLQEEIISKSKENGALTKKHKDLKASMQEKEEEAQNKIASLEAKLKIEKEKNNQLTRELEGKKKRLRVEDEPVTVELTQVVPQPPAPTIKYARYADQGDGFSVFDLLEEEEEETIFEITVDSSNTATFKISSNPGAQKYALSNTDYFLNKTCRYDTIPSTRSSIKTDAPGELKLHGNKWLIVSPAKISFS